MKIGKGVSLVSSLYTNFGSEPYLIGDYTFIGANSMIMPGAYRNSLRDRCL